MNIKSCNPARLDQQIQILAAIREPSVPGFTRRSFTPLYLQGRAYVQTLMQAANLQVELDVAANMLGKQRGQQEGLPPILIGSHTDTVQAGGAYDGIAGVLAAIEAVRLLNEAGVVLQHPVWVVDWLAEEPSEFGLSTVGSRAMVGNLPPNALAYQDPQGRTLYQGIKEMGGQPDLLDQNVRKAGDVAAYLELHIEQSRYLYDAGLSLGVVSQIAGLTRFRVTVDGVADHAGATPMSKRYDALTASSQIILALENLARSREAQQVVATVGQIQVLPNSPNIVPGQAIFTAEMRSIWPDQLAAIKAEFESQVAHIANLRQVSADLKLISTSSPVFVPNHIQDLLKASCDAINQPMLSLTSAAGHDTNQLALIAPVGMLFVPSINGKSHCPEEATDILDIARGTDALVQALIRLDVNC